MPIGLLSEIGGNKEEEEVLYLYTTVPSSSIESTIIVTWYARAGDEATTNAEVKRVIETEESSGRRKKGHYGFQIRKHAAENGVGIR